MEYPTHNERKTMPTKLIVDCSTGEVQEIALTAEEIAEREAMAEQYAEQKAAEEAKKAADAIAKADLLDRLGITEEEARLLLS
jgi:hypothetical protein